jgi:hypothetical protein
VDGIYLRYGNVSLAGLHVFLMSPAYEITLAFPICNKLQLAATVKLRNPRLCA